MQRPIILHQAVMSYNLLRLDISVIYFHQAQKGFCYV